MKKKEVQEEQDFSNEEEEEDVSGDEWTPAQESGAFVISKADAEKSEEPVLWRIDENLSIT
ncbi:unnamed protein product [Trichogramma brassicae]|uniref:Uncharacterized protein n=1 Tax=Trichogramma brassicae TaxID=86971 RepID=A0A6H5IK31_9HYME|nr:unnamed protein product [Trichogramma brassicae]